MSPLTAKIAGFFEWKVLLISAAFTALLMIFEVSFLDTDYLYYNFVFLTSGNWKFISFCLFCELLAIFIFLSLCYFSLLSSWQFKIFFFFFFSFTFFHEYSYYLCYFRLSNLSDFYIAAGATWTQSKNAAYSYFNYSSLLPTLIYLILLIKIKPQKTELGGKIFSVIIFLSLVFFYTVFYLQPKFFTPLEFPTISTANFIRSLVGYGSSKILEHGRRRENIVSPPEISFPQNNIVLVIDESVRGDHLSLNGYERETTPYLDKLAEEKLLANWGISVSGSTCSISSYNLLITGMTPEMLPDIDGKRWNMPSLYQFAKAMKYKTHFFDGQRSSFWGGTPNDLDYIDLVSGVNNFQYDYNTDFRIAEKTNDILVNSIGNFIVVFKRGLHTPFDTNYPSGMESWKPSISDADFPASAKLQPAFLNSFDNSLKYNLDMFFEKLNKGLDLKSGKNIIVYTSDHGQTLGENGIKYSHCQESKSEANVPLFILGNNGKFDTGFKASHANIFPTILDLIGYPKPLRKPVYARSLLEATAADNTDRFYFSANLIYGRKLKFD